MQQEKASVLIAKSERIVAESLVLLWFYTSKNNLSIITSKNFQNFTSTANISKSKNYCSNSKTHHGSNLFDFSMTMSFFLLLLLISINSWSQPAVIDNPTEIYFQFSQGDKPVSIKGLSFMFRLIDSTGKRALVVLQGAEAIKQVNDFKIKVSISHEKVAHLPQGKYKYQLVDIKGGNSERLWQEGIFEVTNTVGVESKAVTYEQANGSRTDSFILLLRGEKDPTVGEHIKAITKEQIARWDSSAKKPNVLIPASNSTIYQSDYANNTKEVVALNGTATIQRQNNQLIVTNINGAVIGFGDASKYREGQLLHVYVDFVKTSGDVLVLARFGNPYGYLLSKTGKYHFTVSRSGAYPFADYNVLVFQPMGNGTGFTINTMTVTDGGAGFDVNTPFVKIGNGAKGDYNSVIIGKDATYTGNFRDAVVVGTNAKTDQQGSVVVGAEANGNHDGTYGCAGGNDQTVVGYAGRGYGWRTTALGAWSAAGGQSSTAIGAGAVALTSHSVALGRGAFAANVPGLAGILTTDVKKIYFGNSYAHRYPTHPLNDKDYGLEVADVPPGNPSTIEIEIHGQDAFDARATPSDFNRPAGHLGLYAGRGTGTGAGGEVRFYTAPVATGTGQNDKNPALPAAKFDASAVPNDGTRFWLFDIQSNALKRVRVAPPDAQGRKMLYIDN